MISSVIPRAVLFTFSAAASNVNVPRGGHPSAEVQINANHIISVTYHFHRACGIARSRRYYFDAISLHRRNKKLLINLMDAVVYHLSFKSNYRAHRGSDKKLHLANVCTRARARKSSFPLRVRCRSREGRGGVVEAGSCIIF